MRIACVALLLCALAAPAAAQPGAAGGLEVSGAAVVELDSAAGVWTFRGSPVVVRRGGLVLRAPLIRYWLGARRLDASNGVELSSENLSVQAPGLAAYLGASLAVTNGRTHAVLGSGGQRSAIEADRVRVWWGERRATAAGSVAVEQSGSRLVADRLDLDLGTDTAVATGGVALEQEGARLSAERVELDRAAQTVVATGAPRVEAEGAAITAARFVAHLEARAVDATGGVRLVRGDVVAEAPEGRFERAQRLLILSGGVRVARGTEVLTAQVVRITFLDGGGVVAVAQGDPKAVGVVPAGAKE